MHTRCLSGTLSIRHTGGPLHLLKPRWWHRALRRCQAGPQHAFPKSLKRLCTRCISDQTSLSCQQNTYHQRLKPSTALTPGPQTCCSWCLGRHCSGACDVHGRRPCQPPSRPNEVAMRQKHQQVRRSNGPSLFPWSAYHCNGNPTCCCQQLPPHLAMAARQLLAAAETCDDTTQDHSQHSQNCTSGSYSQDNSGTSLGSREPQWSVWGLSHLRTLEGLWKQAADAAAGNDALSAGQPSGPPVRELVFSVSGQDQARPATCLNSVSHGFAADCQHSLLYS